MDSVKYTRTFADPEGESHFEDLKIDLKLVDFAPPAPPVSLSAFAPAAQIGFAGVTPGYFGDWHPTPRRQFIIVTAGEGEVETSDGEVRRFRRGDIVLLGDTTGKGHRFRSVGTEPYVNAVVQLPD
jgi:quercetin dioxygenase-like cupin family protein